MEARRIIATKRARRLVRGILDTFLCNAGMQERCTYGKPGHSLQGSIVHSRTLHEHALLLLRINLSRLDEAGRYQVSEDMCLAHRNTTLFLRDLSFSERWRHLSCLIFAFTINQNPPSSPWPPPRHTPVAPPIFCGNSFPQILEHW
jgi:hypothetical protein